MFSVYSGGLNNLNYIGGKIKLVLNSGLLTSKDVCLSYPITVTKFKEKLEKTVYKCIKLSLFLLPPVIDTS